MFICGIRLNYEDIVNLDNGQCLPLLSVFNVTARCIVCDRLTTMCLSACLPACLPECLLDTETSIITVIVASLERIHYKADP